MIRLAMWLVLAVMSSVAAGQSAGTLKGELAQFAPFLGIWEVDANWESGGSLYAISHFEPVLGGVAVELRTWVRREDGTLYERYRSIMRHEEGKGLVSYDLIHDGTMRRSEYELDGSALRTSWSTQTMRIKDSLRPVGRDALQWLVETSPEGENAYTTAMNAQWNRRTPDHLRSVLAGYTPTPLNGRTAELAPMVGKWTLDAAWTDGRRTQSEATHEPGPGGMSLVSNTYPSDNGGPRYHRYVYLSMPGDEPRSFRFFRFSYDGSMSEMVHRITTKPGQPINLQTDYTMPDGVQARQSLHMQGDDQMRWVFDVRPAGQGDWSRRMDGMWRRASR